MFVRLLILVAFAINIGAAKASDWASQRSAVVSVCRTSCGQQGRTPAQCAAYCECTTAGMEAIFSYETLSAANHVFTREEQQRMTEMTIACSRRALGQ
jgi:hypothetical protein